MPMASEFKGFEEARYFIGVDGPSDGGAHTVYVARGDDGVYHWTENIAYATSWGYYVSAEEVLKGIVSLYPEYNKLARVIVKNTPILSEEK